MIRSEKDLILGSLPNCQWTEGDYLEVKNVYEFVSTNLQDGERCEINFFTKPFIKIGDYYIWIPGIMANKNYAMMLYDEVIKQKLHEHKEHSAHMERQIAELFQRNNFNAISSYEYSFKKGEEIIDGEIDVLAYKEKTLFVIQLKTTHARANVRDIYNHVEYALKKAGDQLNRDTIYLDAEEHFDEYKELLNIDCVFEELEVYPLAVSTSFEGDYSLIDDRFRKISLFELGLILINGKGAFFSLKDSMSTEDCYELFFMTLEGNVEAGQEFISKSLEYNKQKIAATMEEYNIWSNGKECTSRDLIEAIEKNKVWNQLEELEPEIWTGELKVNNLSLGYVEGSM